MAAIAAMVLPASALGAADTTQFSVTGGSLAFGTPAPDAPNLPSLTLNGQTQTLNAQMANFAVVDARGTNPGWNVTVSGDNSAGKSPVFKQYCPNASCGSDSGGPGYVGAGYALDANSLSLSSSGASFSNQAAGYTGSATINAPTHSCGSGCFVDAPSASPVKVASAANTGSTCLVSSGTCAGMGTWQTASYSATSLALNTPTTVRVLQTNEVYRVDLVWTLNSGP
jgi:hypothetical protein